MKHLLYLVLLLFLSSCITTVSCINKKPAKYQGKRVFVYGRVISSIELVDISSFTIKSGKKKIMVVTPNYLPLKRDRVLVKGIVKTNFMYRNRLILVILEAEKKKRKPIQSKGLGEKLPKGAEQ